MRDDTLTEDTLFEFAQDCAKVYCARHAAWRRYDDAVQEACVFLLRQRDKGKWETLSKPQLMFRTVNALVRWYQQEKRIRNKFRVEIEYGGAPDVADPQNDYERVDNFDEFHALSVRAARNAQLSGCVEMLEELARGYDALETVKKYGIAPTRARELYRKFLFEFKKLQPSPGMSVFDPDEMTEEEKIECPLFKTESH